MATRILSIWIFQRAPRSICKLKWIMGAVSRNFPRGRGSLQPSSRFSPERSAARDNPLSGPQHPLPIPWSRSTQAIGLSIRGIASQLANLFQIQNSAGTNLFVVNNSGNVGVGTTTATRKFNVFDSSSAPQFRVSQGDSVYGELYVVPVTGDLRISSTGGNIRQNNENLWVCSGDGCAMDATPPAGQGNLIVENSFIFDNGFKFKQDSASTTMYDALDNPILQFDDGE